MQQMVTDSELGDLVHADLRFHFSQWPRAWHDNAQWLRFRDQGGWVAKSSHTLFSSQSNSGRPQARCSHVRYEDGSDGSLCETTALAHLSSPSVPVSLAGTSVGAGSDVVDLTLRGSKALYGFGIGIDYKCLNKTKAGLIYSTRLENSSESMPTPLS